MMDAFSAYWATNVTGVAMMLTVVKRTISGSSHELSTNFPPKTTVTMSAW